MIKQSTNTNPPLTFKQQVIGLIARREKWEKNEYQTSNVILYGLLAECREIMLRLSQKNVADRDAFNDLLESRSIVMNAGTPLETRVVRLVFGDCGRRAHIYSNVLKHAQTHVIAPKDMAAWLVRERGVENVGHNKSSPASKKIMREELIKLAAAKLENTPFLMELTAVEALEPSNNDYVSFSLAVIRKTRDGKFGVVYGINRTSLIETALAIVGKELELAASATAIVETAKSLEITRRELQQGIASKATSRRPPKSAPAVKAA